MDAEKKLLDIECYSEKTHDHIGCGILVPNLHPSVNDIDPDEIMEALEESFLELLCEFESSFQRAFDDGKKSGIKLDDLFMVFGHFHFSCSMENKPVNIDLGIDPDKYMYPRLAEYLKIDAE